MADIEKKNLASTGTNEDNEIGLLINRYLSEGRPDNLQYLSDNRK